MYVPEITGVVQSSDSVLVRTDDDVGFAVGRYYGESRPESESYEIHIIDHMTDEIKEVSYFHKEDLFANCKENVELLRNN